jgi:hypothetical protein
MFSSSRRAFLRRTAVAAVVGFLAAMPAFAAPMIKCPFCHFDNEDGALFCEQCKSDLAGVEPVRPRPGGPGLR